MSSEKKTKKPEKARLVEENSYSLVLSRDEIISAVQILSFAKGVFEQMAVNSQKEGDDKATVAWAARAKLSMLLYAKLRDIASIGEPPSGELH